MTMKRRGNKSSKVPNVKLRPARPEAPSSSRESQNTWWAEDSQQCDDAGVSALDLCPRPFKGVVVCATGIVDKPTLFKQAIELGATSASAFTDKVTHLVAESHGGAKYKCALERKVPILKPSWISECYQIWLKGDDVDLDESVGKHRLPIFSDVVMSLSGIEITRRAQIIQLLTQKNGVYAANIERPVKVTHLLCSGDEETEKIRYANKFNARGEARIQLVWEEWFWDSLEFGGRFDEERYQVQHPRPERKLVPEESSSSSPPVPPESTPPSSVPAESQDQEDPEEEAASVKRIPGVTLQVWESLLRPRGFEIAAGKLVHNPSMEQETELPPLPESPARIPSSSKGNGSVISSFRRANSFMPLPKDPTTNASHQPFRRTTTLPALPPPGTRNLNNGESSTATVSSCPSLFTGLKFRVLGEARCANVRSAIEASGGVVVPESEMDDGVNHIIVRLVSGSKIFREESDEEAQEKYRTECWLELCIYHERICLPDEHIFFRPLKIETPVPGSEDIRLSFSGFDESQSWPIRRLIRALGMVQLPSFSRHATHLLCPSGTGAKFQKALEWNVPVVNMQWLVDMVNTGVVGPASRYLVHGPGGSSADAGERADMAVPVDKGKGREEDDHRMTDITNNCGRGQENDGSQDVGGKWPPGGVGRPSIRKTGGLQDLAEEPPDRTSLPGSSATTTLSTPVSLEYLAEPSPASLPSSRKKAGRQTLDEIRADDAGMRIPSSKSPSPMKIPGTMAREATVSPVKIPSEVTRALQDSITSLLGKRQTSEEELVVKTGKRPRAHLRSKVKMAKETAGSSHAPMVRGTSPRDSSEVYEEMGMFNVDGRAEESMRVEYEDPGQMDEKKRLMSLLGSQRQPQEGKSVGGRWKNEGVVRRSSRTAGF